MASDAKYGEVTVEREPGAALNGTDEPVFLIRARDASSVEAILRYRDAAEDVGAGEDLLDAAREAAGRFEAWQADHPDLVKLPD